MRQPMLTTTAEPDAFIAPRLALQRQEAAAALNVGVDTFDRHIRPQLSAVYVGSVRLWPVKEIQRWLDENQRRVG